MSVRKMKNLLGIGQARAEHLHKAIENDDLFEVLPNGRFKVSSFKEDTIKMSKKGRRFKGANTFIIEVNKDYKLRDIYNRLNELLFLRPIGSNEANSSHVSVNKNKKSLCRSSYITNKEFQGAVGLGRCSVSNIKKRLLNKGEIKSTYAQLHVADKRNKESVNTMLRNLGLRKPTFEQGNNVYGVVPCSYVITSVDAKKSCGRFKIYSYQTTKGKARTKIERQLSVNNMPD